MKHYYLSLLAALLNASVGAQTSPPAEELGKLFLTPEKRHALERQRQLNLREAEGLETDTLQLNGVVQRSSGRHSVWLNQRMQSEKDRGMGVRMEPRSPGAAELRLDDESSTRLRVGESINRTTKKREDVVAPGEVNVGKPR
jgi:hypothetical protein